VRTGGAGTGLAAQVPQRLLGARCLARLAFMQHLLVHKDAWNLDLFCCHYKILCQRAIASVRDLSVVLRMALCRLQGLRSLQEKEMLQPRRLQSGPFFGLIKQVVRQDAMVRLSDEKGPLMVKGGFFRA